MEYCEFGLAKLLSGVRGHDGGLMTRGGAFAATPTPTLAVSVPEIGPTGSAMDVSYSQRAAGGEKFPSVSWEPPAPAAGAGEVAEYALLIEDPDVPIPGLCIHHAIFYGIPPTTTQARAQDVEVAEQGKEKGVFTTKAGWRFVPNLRGKAYVGPKPPIGHGSHRYFYTVVALSKKVDQSVVGEGSGVSKANFVKAIEGNIVAWGEWVGTFESKW